MLDPCLSASVRVKESHQLARPLIHLDARYKLTLEFLALQENLTHPKTAKEGMTAKPGKAAMAPVRRLSTRLTRWRAPPSAARCS